ncbi:MAG: DUF882 domain-containing protein [Rhodospirillales bacterium]|nr:DUF882 domain-containing protein [Rhodospirillales bacterium]
MVLTTGSTSELKQAAVESETAKQFGLDNRPSNSAMARLEVLIHSIVQPVEKHFGKRVAIVSGYRSPEVNSRIGSPQESAHVRGEAVDIWVDGVTSAFLACWISKNLDYDQVVVESDRMVHVSIRSEGNRMQGISGCSRK